MSAKKARFYGCTPIYLPDAEQIEAARIAVSVNPTNAPTVRDASLSVARLAGLTSALWDSRGVKLPVFFLEQTPADLKTEILRHGNCWFDEARCNVQFVLTNSQGDSVIRISRGASGYWSHVGSFCLRVPKNAQTMNLERITMQTPERERRRVIGHEFGHAIGWQHEHLRPEIVQRLDPQKVIEWGARTQGWSRQTSIDNMLTPLRPNEITASPFVDEDSLMAYHFDGSLTKDGKPIAGGSDLTANDKAFAAKVYPRPDAPPSPPPVPPVGVRRLLIESDSVIRVTPQP